MAVAMLVVTSCGILTNYNVQIFVCRVSVTEAKIEVLHVNNNVTTNALHQQRSRIFKLLQY